MKKGVFLIVIFLAMIPGLNAQSSDEYGFIQNQEQKRAHEFIRLKKNDTSLYYGEGIATIGKDLGKAMEEAKKRALANLSESISVKVKSDIKQVVTDKTGEGSIEEGRSVDFSKMVNVYTEKSLEDVQMEYFQNYPKQGEVFYCAWIEKAKYQEKVQNELEAKRNRIRTSLEEGMKQLAAGNIVSGIQHLINADQERESFFHDLPIQMDVDKDGYPEDVKAFIESRVINTFSNMEFSFEEGNFTYSNEGVLSNIPVLTAHYYNESGAKEVVPNLPLKVDFISGTGRILGGVKTGPTGTAHLQIRNIDPGYQETVLAIEVDKAQIKGLERYNPAVMPEIKVILKKIKTVALAVSFYAGGQKRSPESLIIKIRSALLQKGFSSVSFILDGRRTSSSDLDRAQTMNIDYLLEISIDSTEPQTVGGYKNMYACSASGVVSLYQLPQGVQWGTEMLPGAKGVGTTETGAAMNSCQKLENSAYQTAIKMIGRLQ